MTSSGLWFLFLESNIESYRRRKKINVGPERPPVEKPGSRGSPCFHIMRPHIPAAPPGTRSALGSIFKHRRANFILILDGLRWPWSSERNSKSRNKTTSASKAKGTAGRHESVLIEQPRLFCFCCCLFAFLELCFKISAHITLILTRWNMLKMPYGKKNNGIKTESIFAMQKREGPDYSEQKASLNPLSDAGGWAEMKR